MTHSISESLIERMQHLMRKHASHRGSYATLGTLGTRLTHKRKLDTTINYVVGEHCKNLCDTMFSVCNHATAEAAAYAMLEEVAPVSNLSQSIQLKMSVMTVPINAQIQCSFEGPPRRALLASAHGPQTAQSPPRQAAPSCSH